MNGRVFAALALLASPVICQGAVFAPSVRMKSPSARMGGLAPLARSGGPLSLLTMKPLGGIATALLPSAKVPALVLIAPVTRVPVGVRLVGQNDTVGDIISRTGDPGSLPYGQALPVGREIFEVLIGEGRSDVPFEGGEEQNFFGKPAGDSIRESAEIEDDGSPVVPAPLAAQDRSEEGSRIGAFFRSAFWTGAAIVARIKAVLLGIGRGR